jgi:SAM-dependent methyltransferase
MGRFASTVEYYVRYREPYPPAFFQAIMERLALHGDEALLDVGCGPAPLSIGIAPFVGSCTGLDPEALMIEAASAAARAAGVRLTLHSGCIEDFSADRSYDIVTIGRALHWLDRRAALDVLERVVAPSGRVQVCGSTSVESPLSPWLKPYQELCNRWSNAPDRKRYCIESRDWFAGSRFGLVDNISVAQEQRIGVDGMIGRALSRSHTSRAVLGDRQAEFEAAIRAALEPFSQNGSLSEEIVSRAAVFGRLT